MPTLVHAESSKILDEVNFLSFLHCHISGCMMPRPVKFSEWCLHYAGVQEIGALAHYLIWLKCTDCLKMWKNDSQKHFLCTSIDWSFDLTSDLQLATNSAAGVHVTQVIWRLSLNSLLPCGYANMGKIIFFLIFWMHYRGHGQLSPASLFSHLILEILN